MHIERFNELGRRQILLDRRQGHLGLELGEWLRLFRLIASLQSILPILEKAITSVHSLSNQWGPAFCPKTSLSSDAEAELNQIPPRTI
jgi:hypothetical protein